MEIEHFTFFASVSAFARLRWFRFYFLALRLASGLIAVAAVSHRQFFSFALGVRSSFVGWFRVCV